MNLKEKTYTTLKEKIISGEYAPGQLLDEKVIISELGISRTPFREAISMLVSEHLVKSIPNRGMFVREYSYKEMLEIFAVRYIIEPEVMRSVCRTVPRKEIQNLIDRNEKLLDGNLNAMVEEDNLFHNTLLNYLDNSYLAELMRKLYEQDSMMFTHNYSEVNAADSIKEHLAIAYAIRDNEPDQAAEAAKKHIAAARARAMGSVMF